jgi:AcrR family transcriptional regulator
MIYIHDSSTLAAPMAGSETRREAILEAMVTVVGRQGYKATSVADVIEQAKVSRTTFYKHFEDKHECFLAAYDLVVERVMSEVVANCDGSRTWLERMRTGLATIVEMFALDPELGRTAIVEVAAAGSDARQRHWDAIGKFTEFLADGEKLAGERELPRNIGLMAAGAVSGLIFDELLTGRAERLPEMLPDLLFAMLVPYIGPKAATEEMRKAAASRGPAPPPPARLPGSLR